MKLWILHDTVLGNGKKLSEEFAHEFTNWDINIGHVNKTDPKIILNDNPDLLIVGAAVRAFSISPNTKKWIKNLQAAGVNHANKLKFGAVFLTHSINKAKIGRKGERLKKRLADTGIIDRVYEHWISGRVIGQTYGFHDGVVEDVKKIAHEIQEWMKKNTSN